MMGLLKLRANCEGFLDNVRYKRLLLWYQKYSSLTSLISCELSVSPVVSRSLKETNGLNLAIAELAKFQPLGHQPQTSK